ncbi:hypothetical protein ACFLVW_03505 [Chloroflexota bacterium]
MSSVMTGSQKVEGSNPSSSTTRFSNRRIKRQRIDRGAIGHKAKRRLSLKRELDFRGLGDITILDSFDIN